jgi:hypothetical protein
VFPTATATAPPTSTVALPPDIGTGASRRR